MGYTNGMEEEEEEDIRIEKEIEIELSKISITSSETDDTDIELSAEISSDSEPISDELPESVLHYLNFVRSRSQNAERLILQDLENDEISNDFYKVVPNNASECLAKLASKYNEDPEELRKRVLSEIEDEELEMSSTPVKAFEPNNGGAISSSNGVADRYYLTDDGDTGVSFSFQEVEERCKREYELWVEQQKELECEQIKKQKAKRDMEQIQSKEEEKRRQLRQEELMAEQKKLEMLHVQQQAMLEEERLKEEEAWNEQLRQHKELIKNLHVQIEEEKKAFEEQKAKERQQLAEQHNMAAVKIQTRFRGFVVYKKYAPILREWRAELKRKREMQGSMEREQKEKEERLKRRALEKKQQGEGERQKQEEKERQELAEKKRRHEEYEKKKEIIRLQREEQQMLETLKREKDQLKFVVASKMEPENKEKETTLAKDQEIEKVEEHEENKTAQIQSGVSSENANNLEMIKKEEQDSTIGKPKMILEKEQTKLLEEIRYEENKQDEKHYGMKHEKLWHNNGSTEGRELGKVIPNKISVENKVPYVEDNCSTIVEFQRSSDTSALNTETTAVVNWESSTLSNHISMDAQLDSGDTGQTDKLNALEQIKKELALKEMHEEATDHWAKGENLVPCLEQSLMLSDSVEEKRLAWMKTCKSWSRIYRENQRKKVLEKSRTRKVSASMMPPLSAVMIIQADPWNSLQQVTTVNFQDLPGCSLSTLSQCSKLQFLSLRRCGLLTLEGLSSCKDLKYINVEENNIQVINCENLENLCILILNNNNISSLHGLYGCNNLWNLELSHNKLTRIVGLKSLKNLQRLVVNHNQLISTKGLSDTPSLVYIDCSFNHLTHVEGIENCGLLQILKLQGNNLIELPSLEDHVLLRELYLEDNSISSLEKLSLYWLPLLQILFISQNRSEFSVDAVQLQCWYLKKLMKVSNEHRYAHEYGVLNTTKGEEPEKQTNHLNQEAINVTEKNNSFIAGAKENIQDMLHMPERWITSDHIQPVSVNSFMALPEMGRNKEYKQKKQCVHNEESKDNNVLISPKRNKFSKRITASNGGNYLQHFDSLQNLAATVIQSYWRSYSVRKKINFYTRLHLAATIIQSFWRSYCLRKKMVVNNKEQHKLMDKHKAATIIQAFWKGFCLRKKLATALAAVKTDEVEDDYKEVNVDDFMFDEAVIEKEWPALDSTRFLSQTVLFSNQFPSPKYNETAKHEEKSHHFKWPPHKTWQLRERPASLLSENSQISNRSGQSTLSRLTDLKHSQKSSLRLEKEEKISEEWGFKEISTAQLMLRRAHKMKAKKASSKKLDPAVRLALFKNNENKHPPVKPPKKATGKAGYFEDKEDELAHIDKVAEKIERNKERTYQWLHTQVWDYEEASPRNEKCKHFLPEIDPEILKGGRVQLVTSPVRREDTDLELVSMTSGSTLTQNREKNNQPQRHSAGSSKKDAPAPERSHLGPSHKERISFRDHPVQLSGGWGSGKKKMKPLK
ncbi:leucine-rich repeat and IQ domain-containing protein 1 isoform X6 [Hemicordylus capensis]|uniref:leucine-rich repeat and IQ domain-containing protein 1 isoform X6 n=1 Tax=Hemicordylus capensis TaxID=884348 RepID=UPI0023049C41|nr:leucine-rich repeat and IQ domain-containing protein 1 isoform X6 [Hemicordylus capensis]